ARRPLTWGICYSNRPDPACKVFPILEREKLSKKSEDFTPNAGRSERAVLAGHLKGRANASISRPMISIKPAEKSIRPTPLVFFFFDLDSKGLEKLQILIANLQLGIGAERGDQRSLVGSVFALLADPYRSFENEENVVAAFLDAGHDFGDRFGIGQRLV